MSLLSNAIPQKPKFKGVFDTSFLVRAFEGISNANGINIIDAEFPCNTYDRIIHDYVLDEFFFGKKVDEEERIERADFYENRKIYTMEVSHRILFKEFKDETAVCCLEKNGITESNILLFLRGKHYDQATLEDKFTQLKRQREHDREVKFYEIIGSDHDKNLVLSLELLRDDLSKLIREGQEVPFEFEKKKIIMRGREFKLIDMEKYKIIKERAIENIQTELPTLYQILILEGFLRRLNRLNPRKRKFIELNGLEKKMKIEPNTLADSQISLSALCYCDVFATCDQGQAQLIKFLFPEYTHKIKYYKEDSTKKNYNYIDVKEL